MIIALLLAMILFSFLISYTLPKFYNNAKSAVIKNAVDLESDDINVEKKPLLFILILSPCLLYLLVSNGDVLLSTFIFILAVAAYIDRLTKWVPDIIIYIAVFFSLSVKLTHGANYETSEMLLSAGLGLLSFLLVNFVSWLKSKKIVYSCGDVYLIPAICIWLNFDAVLPFIGLATISAAVLEKNKASIAFVPYLYAYFCMYFFVCVFLGGV